MPIEVPENIKEVSDRIKTDVQNSLPESNPFLRNSFLGSIIAGLAGRIFGIFYQISKVLVPSLFLDTATGESLERLASIEGITRNPATQATGSITATGTASTAIPAGTEFQSSDGIVLKTQTSRNISAQTISVSTLTMSVSTVTATTASEHNLSTGVSVTISGAVETDYNGTYDIVVTGVDTFTYEITATPTTPATGTILASFTTASLDVKTDDFGQASNLNNGEVVTISTPIAGLNDDAVVQFGEVSGGTDIETDDDLRERALFKKQNPTSQFNSATIVKTAREVSGVTRVWVERATPTPGKVTIYFVRDNDANIIPSGVEVAAVKDLIIQDIAPAHTPESYIIVAAPTAVDINFTFTALSPNTTSMQNSITTSLQQFFAEQVTVGVNITEDVYRSAIQNTVDNETGEQVISFALSTPSGDISISSGQLGILGTVTF